MISQWTTWLRRLAADGHGGVSLPAIVRGLSYPLTIKIPLDVTADAFTGSVAISPDAEEPLEEFAVSIGAWDGTYTPVTLTLSQAQVAALPADGDFDGLEEVVFDILRTPSGSHQRRYLAGNIPISGKVTDGA